LRMWRRRRVGQICDVVQLAEPTILVALEILSVVQSSGMTCRKIAAM
jgi:hypothetical protein